MKSGGIEKVGRNATPATLEYTRDDGMSEALKVDFALRKPEGHGRAQFCSTPLMRLLLPKKQGEVDPLDGTLFDHSNHGLKLYLPCNYTPAEGDILKREYAVYQALEATGVVAYKTRYLEVKLNWNGKEYSVPGFILEDAEDIQKRCKAAKVEEIARDPKTIQASGEVLAPDQFMPFLHYVFARNTDYTDDYTHFNAYPRGSWPDHHNTRVFTSVKKQRYFAVIDLDNADLVGGMHNRRYQASESWANDTADEMLKYIPWKVGSRSPAKTIPSWVTANKPGSEEVTYREGDSLRVYKMLKQMVSSNAKVLASVQNGPLNADDKKTHSAYYTRWFINAEKALADAPFKE